LKKGEKSENSDQTSMDATNNTRSQRREARVRLGVRLVIRARKVFRLKVLFSLFAFARTRRRLGRVWVGRAPAFHAGTTGIERLSSLSRRVA